MKLLLSLVFAMALNAAMAAQKIPLREGEYSGAPCHGAPDIMASMGVYVLTSGPKKGAQFLTPLAEGQDGYCHIKRLKINNDVYSGYSRCESGTRINSDYGSYRFGYQVVNETTFISKGKTYQWCAGHR